MTATKKDWEDILTAVKRTDVVAIKCVYNVDRYGAGYDEHFTVGETYYATYGGANDLDIYKSVADVRDGELIWSDFNGNSHGRFTFFVLADVAITAEAVAKLEATSTDELIAAYKKLKVDEKSILEVLKTRLKGLPL